jgi:short-subunit dehydrogenase
MKYNNKTVLITGASSGIGKALSLAYAELGANVVLLARNADKLNELTEEIISKSGSAFSIPCDVTGFDKMKESIEIIIEKYKRIDIAFLNAGISGKTNFFDLDVEQLKEVYNTNIFGVMNGFKAITPYMVKEKSGIIAVTGSLADCRGLPNSGSYSSSKIAISHLVESAGIELKKYGIKIILIRPGFVESKMTEKNQYQMPYLMTAEKAAKIIIKGIEKNKSKISFPFPMVALTNIVKFIPDIIYHNFAEYFIKKKGF